MAITREGPPSRRGLGNVDSMALVWASWDLGPATAGATLRTVRNISLSGCEELLGYPSEPGFQQDGVMDLGGRELGENAQGRWNGGEGGFYWMLAAKARGRERAVKGIELFLRDKSGAVSLKKVRKDVGSKNRSQRTETEQSAH